MARPKNKRLFFARPYKQLACDILRHAIMDARQGDAEAIAWLAGSRWCAYLLDAVGVDHASLVRVVQDLDALA